MDFEQRKTHSCGELTAKENGKEVFIKGWVDRRRDLGQLIFIDIRDRKGKTQVVFDPSRNSETHAKAGELRNEYVISVRGTVGKRLEPNTKISTGEIEVLADELRILNPSETPPISINEDGGENEDIRLKWRFLDLRRPFMQRNMLFRSKVMQETRKLLSAEEFAEIETPILMKSTPEGARDFLVPSRVNPGKFYALPQSPQTYKQILMVAGYERYFQIAKCFRDEDLRADRQPEFTQIDCEMSFVNAEEIYDTFGGFVTKLFKNVMGIDIPPIPRMTYEEAMEGYGCDKPDLRFDMKMVDFSEILKSSGFKVFDSVLETEGGAVKGIKAEKCADFSRKVMDDLTEFVAGYGAKGLVWLKVTENGLEGPSAKFLKPEILAELQNEADATVGDVIFIIASTRKVVNVALGQLRLEIAKRKNLMKKDQFVFTWVTDFPMFEYSETDKRWSSTHHPFTAPLDEDVSLLYSPEYYFARAKAYDIILNGNEIGGGSIRIHQAGLQSKIFELLGIKPDEARLKFGFLLDAFKYGAPPHGGIAFGLDRLVMIMLGLDSIRDVIAFPKTASACSLMDESPSNVDSQQLDELGIALKK
ncbi:MAG: aspartate--tRNA ligase [Fibrobacteres bacterium]|nr:aspartate--tRNA ligase [Fibrobacterota bacterium]